MNVKLLLAGEFYGDEGYYQKLIEKYQLQDRIYLHTSFIPNDAVGKYFCAADVVILPYRSATQSGITQVAYHYDVPMIVTRVGDYLSWCMIRLLVLLSILTQKKSLRE